MNRPSNRRPSWLWLLIGITGCGLLLARMTGSFVTAQENPIVSPPHAHAQPTVPPPVAAPEFLPRPAPNEQRILDALDKPTEVAFVDIPLTDALAYLKEVHSIEIWLDKEALSVEGIATDQLVSLSLSGISLRSTLRLLLEPLQLTYVSEDEVMKITTRDAASKLLVTRTYPAGDLFDSREEAHELVEVIVSGLGLRPKVKEVKTGSVSIKQLGWGSSETSAPTKESGTFAVSFKARAIVARQTHAVHDQIRQLLRDLREAKSFAPVQPLADWSVPGGRHPHGYDAPPSAYAPSKPTPLDEFSPGFRPDPRRTLPDPDQNNLEPPAKLPTPQKPGTVR